MDYISAIQASIKWGITPQRVRILCREGRIEGVIRFGHTYLIPHDADKPKDARIKSGLYIKDKSR